MTPIVSFGLSLAANSPLTPHCSLGLPSQMHTSYPYGNPLKLNHPAALGTYPFGLGDAHLYSDLSYEPGGGLSATMTGHAHTNAQAQSQSALRWDDMALDELLPLDPRKLAAERAARARKGAAGATQNAAPPPPSATATDAADAAPDATGAGVGETTGPTGTSDGEDDDDMGLEESF